MIRWIGIALILVLGAVSSNCDYCDPGSRVDVIAASVEVVPPAV